MRRTTLDAFKGTRGELLTGRLTESRDRLRLLSRRNHAARRERQMDRKAYSAAKKVARVMIAFRGDGNVRAAVHGALAFVSGTINADALDRMTAELLAEVSRA